MQEVQSQLLHFVYRKSFWSCVHNFFLTSLIKQPKMQLLVWKQQPNPRYFQAVIGVTSLCVCVCVCGIPFDSKI